MDADNIISLFIKVLKINLESSMNTVKKNLAIIQWNAQSDNISQTLKQAEENFHLSLHKDGKGKKYKLYLEVGIVMIMRITLDLYQNLLRDDINLNYHQKYH